MASVLDRAAQLHGTAGPVNHKAKKRVLSQAALLLVATTAIVSFALAQALVLSAPRHGHLTMDLPGAVQKFHSRPTPRVGGIAVYLALACGWMLIPSTRSESTLLLTVLVGGMPALVAGLAEDVTKRVSVRMRLAFTLGSGALAALWSGVAITRVDLLPLDVLSYWPVAVMFTAFAVGGVSNAINIIDGFHGLASGTVIISLLALAGIAFSVGDVPLATVSLIATAALAGFWLVNFPWGKLFLGDGGAYFSGFTLAWLSVELLARNPQVSAWASVLLCGYPTVEVVYSIIRRRRQQRSPGDADRDHLHSLIAEHLVQPRLRASDPNLRNATVSLVMWVCALVPVLPALFLYTQGKVLLPVLLACFAAYHLLYRGVASLARGERGGAKGSLVDEAARKA